MRSGIFLLMLSLVLMTSGCLRETGDLVINFTDLNISEHVGISLSEDEEPGMPEAGEEEPEKTPANVTVNETGEVEIDPCESVVCDDSITTCPDGTVMTCENTCDNETGNCTSCIPDCSGHEEECNLTCGACEVLDEDECGCITILNCEGNGICESGEWPDGEDCMPFGECDDEDECTLDVFNSNHQSCTHVDICCNDEDECTEDGYNYTAQECLHIYICCNNSQCDPGDEDYCPEECEEEPEEQPGDVNITHINETEETVTLEGYGIDMTNWTIEDAALHTYTFPDGFFIDGTVYLHRGYDNNTATDLYWQSNSYVWNNDHDNATLRNETGGIASFFEY
jgi:hypothetical protein